MKLICPQCRRENESERIYCHDCGTRLDRSSLAKEKTSEEDPQATRKRLKSMLQPQRAKLRHQFFQGSKLVLGALAIAALVQMGRAPGLPEPPKADEFAAQINLDLENASMTPRGPLRYSEAQVNTYLAYTLKSKKAALSKYLDFQRAVVSFEENLGQLTVERAIFGIPIFTTVAGTPRIEGGALKGTIRSGSIGRLPVHPAILQSADFLFADVRTALDREQKSIAKLGGIELHPKQIVFLPKQPLPQP